jgi:hypothetical protein
LANECIEYLVPLAGHCGVRLPSCPIRASTVFIVRLCEHEAHLTVSNLSF